jgi:hypothetical protein
MRIFVRRHPSFLSEEGFMRSFAVLTILLATLSSAAPVSAQDSSEPLPPRRVGGMVGAGNTFGGLGGSLEWFAARSRISIVAGFGATRGAGVAAAGGLRGHTGGARHRLFVEAAVVALALSDAAGLSDSHPWYGPALSVGYSYTSKGGLAFLAGAGAGRAVSISETWPVLNVGLGYTWRR